MIFRSYIRQYQAAKAIPKVIQYGKKDGAFTFPHMLLAIQRQASLSLPQCNPTNVSIIIPKQHKSPELENCLNSIILNTKGIAYEIIVADTSFHEDFRQMEQYAPLLTYIRLQEEKSIAQLCNVAAQQAKGHYLCFLSPDAIVQHDWLLPLVETLEKEPEIGLSGSKAICPNTRILEAGSIIFSDSSLEIWGSGAFPSEWKYNYLRDTDSFSYSAICLRKTLWDKLGGFDENPHLPYAYTRADLAFRVRYHMHLHLAYQPRSVIMLQTERDRNFCECQEFYTRWQAELECNHVVPTSHYFLACEHARAKKSVLVIDRDIPAFSKDTGSRSTYQYMHFFKRHGYCVKLFPHKLRADTLLHERFATTYLEDGFEIISEKLIPWLQRNGKYIDYVYLNRPEHALKYLPICRCYTKAFILYQGHDLHYLRRYRGNLIAKRPNAKAMMEQEKQVELDICRRADQACFFSQAEVDILHAEQAFSHATAIPLFLYNTKRKESITYQATSRHGLIFVAGFAHAPNIDAALWFSHDVFPLIRQSVPNIKLCLAGSNPPEEIRELSNSSDIIVTGQITENELEHLYQRARLTVVPLRFGAGVKGKVIESIFHKVPVVTTSIGVEGINNDDGLITVADSSEKLAESIAQLYTNTSKLEALSSACHPWIDKLFSDAAAKRALSPYMKELT